MVKKITAVVAALILIWVGIRFIFAVHVDEPGYRLVAGRDYIQEKGSYCSRFANVTDPGRMNLLSRGWNTFNLACFRMSYPLFQVQDSIFGTTVRKGDAGYDTYMAQVGKIAAVNMNWDYVLASTRDGRGMAVYRNGKVVQQID